MFSSPNSVHFESLPVLATAAVTDSAYLYTKFPIVYRNAGALRFDDCSQVSVEMRRIICHGRSDLGFLQRPLPVALSPWWCEVLRAGQADEFGDRAQLPEMQRALAAGAEPLGRQPVSHSCER